MKPLLDRSAYDHPEHFDDEVRAFRTSERYVPTPLEALLFELAGHRCTICAAPWLEIHHIDELGDGGKTEYQNLVVLCPNCHTRVHATGVPSRDELRHYKIKQEIAYELPVLSRLTVTEKAFLSHVAGLTREERLAVSLRLHREIPAPDQDEAVRIMRTELGYFCLLESGIVSVDLETAVTLVGGKSVSVALRVRLTGKGAKWVQYLEATGRIPNAEA